MVANDIRVLKGPEAVPPVFLTVNSTEMILPCSTEDGEKWTGETVRSAGSTTGTGVSLSAKARVYSAAKVRPKSSSLS